MQNAETELQKTRRKYTIFNSLSYCVAQCQKEPPCPHTHHKVNSLIVILICFWLMACDNEISYHQADLPKLRMAGEERRLCSHVGICECANF